MTTDERDTQFQGFAKLLFTEMLNLHDDSIIIPPGALDIFGDEPIQEYRDIIARAAYRLVYHTLSNTTQAMAAECEHRPAIAEEIRRIPDLTAWQAPPESE